MWKSAAAVAVGVLAGLAAYHVYPEVGTGSALLVLVFTSWFLWGLTDPERLAGYMGMTLNPAMMSFMAFSGSFIYFSFRGFSGPNKFLASLGVGVLGGVISMLLYQYWNIGG
ncbi:MAG: hypothetical protein ABEJ03_05255 [Candidatus Nanohaloarchaea archaeon]